MRAPTDEGSVAAYVWDDADGMEPIRPFWDVVPELGPAATALEEGPALFRP